MHGEVEVASQEVKEVEETAGEVVAVAPTPSEDKAVDWVTVKVMAMMTNLHGDVVALDKGLEITLRLKVCRQVCLFFQW